MRHSGTSPQFLWQSCAEPSAAWFLVWMPLALLALDGDPTPSSAMARLLAVLMVAALIWARGLGSGGELADRLFVGGWAGAWAAALGTLVTAGAWSASWSGSAALVATLMVGAGWLGWAYHERQELRTSRPAEEPFDPSHREPAGATSILLAWLGAAFLFAFSLSLGHAHWSDGLVLLVGLASFTAFQHGRVVPTETPA